LTGQKTLKRAASISGIGLFTGEKASATLLGAPAGAGIVFRRVDLPGSPEIPARLESVRDTLRSTRLATASASLAMVEHLLSALSASEIDNCRIDVEGPEVPACDGSARPFFELIEQAGTLQQEAPKNILRIERPVHFSDREAHLVALPSDDLKISYTLHYPQSQLLGSQFYSFSVSREGYKAEIASCRTFSLYEEIAPLIERGFIKGGGLDNALVIKENRILNPEGARFPDEMVRHKILDLLGDLSLIGRPLKAHIIAIRSGHASNIAFAKLLESARQRA
jgi:UDP-3-O-[3-hydroxymyristoyl] N-acetylglucosamine deacetylase